VHQEITQEQIAVTILRMTLEAATPPALPDGLRLLRDVRVVLEAANLLREFPVLRFFCDWALHAEVTDSDVVQRKLLRINEFFLGIMSHPAPFAWTADPISKLEQALEVATLRSEMRQLFAKYALPAPFLESFLGWQQMLARLYGEVAMKPLRLPDPAANGGARKPRGSAVKLRQRLEAEWIALKGSAEHLVTDLRLEVRPPPDDPKSTRGTLHWTAMVSRRGTGKGRIEITVAVTPLEPPDAFAHP
jgi:hypothetical protein